MVELLGPVLPVLGDILHLSHARVMAEVVQHLLNGLLVGNLLQLDECFSLAVSKTMHKHMVPSLPLLPRQLKVLQLGDGRPHPLPAGHPPHLGCRALDKGPQDGGCSRGCGSILASPKASLQYCGGKCRDENKGNKNSWKTTIFSKETVILLCIVNNLCTFELKIKIRLCFTWCNIFEIPRSWLFVLALPTLRDSIMRNRLDPDNSS